MYATAKGNTNINKFDNCFFWYDNMDHDANVKGFIEITADAGKAVWNTIIQNSIFYNTENENKNMYGIYQGQGGGTVESGNQYWAMQKTNLK